MLLFSGPGVRLAASILAIAGLFAPVRAAAQEPPVVVVGEEDTLEPELDDADYEELDEEDVAFSPGPVSLGLSGLVGTRDDTAGSLAPTWTAGFDVGLRLGELFAIGVRRVTASWAPQGRDQWAVGLSPYVEIAGRVWERIELFGQLGAALALRMGDGTDLDVAPFSGGGVRFFVADVFSIAVEGAVHVPATRSFLLGHEVFPRGAVILQGGLALAFHL